MPLSYPAQMRFLSSSHVVMAPAGQPSPGVPGKTPPELPADSPVEAPDGPRPEFPDSPQPEGEPFTPTELPSEPAPEFPPPMSTTRGRPGGLARRSGSEGLGRTHVPPSAIVEDADIAARLDEYASLLEQQGDDVFRVRAYREAAVHVRSLEVSLVDIFATEGLAGLIAQPKIGRGIAAAIAEMLTSGHWSQLDRLRGDVSPARLFMTIPGLGPGLARRLADDEDIETLEELEIALQPGGPPIRGFGRRRREMILAQVSDRLGRIRNTRRAAGPVPPPPVGLLLDADKLYRDRAAAGQLRLIAPKRFNPEGTAWLPVMHARRDDWHLTLMWSNTARAHELGKTRDWLVVYFRKEGQPEGRCTIVTETRGALAGRRVVRGREAECESLLATPGQAAQDRG